MKLNLPKLTEERKAFLRESMANTIMFNGLMGDIGRLSQEEQLPQLDFILALEMKRKPGGRRSIAKRIHGRACSVRSWLEWQVVEDTLRRA